MNKSINKSQKTKGIGLGIVHKVSIQIPIPWVRYQFLNDTFFYTRFQFTHLLAIFTLVRVHFKTTSVTRFSLCVVNKSEWYREQTAPYTFESLSRISLRRIASSRTHLVLQAYCLTDVNEINPLGIEIWYRTTRRFSIIDGIKAIQSVTKSIELDTQP